MNETQAEYEKPVELAGRRLFLVAFVEDAFADLHVLYHENAPSGMDVTEPGFGADDDYWPLPLDGAQYPLLVFEGRWETLAEHHARECGCADPNGSECAAYINPEWSWMLTGDWRKATTADLLRAKVVSS